MDKINIYRDGDAWCYSAWDDGAHDHNDVLAARTESEARSEVAALFPGARIVRVDDCDSRATHGVF